MKDQMILKGFPSVPDEFEIYQKIKSASSHVLESYWMDPNRLIYKPRQSYSSICLMDESNLVCRLHIRGKSHYIALADRYKALIPASVEAVKTKSEDNYIRIPFLFWTDIHAPLFASVVDAVIMGFPSDFACCAQYKECSDAKKCLHPDEVFYLSCYYRRNLRNNRIFYGVNENS